MENKICCVFNFAAHYRESIFKRMDSELKCDFYFGNTAFIELKKLDYSYLQGFKHELKGIRIRSFIWYFGILKTLKNKYNYYIITGDPFHLSNWLLLFYCHIKKKQIYMWCHGLSGEPHRRYKSFIYCFYKSATGGLLLYSNFSRDYMIKQGFEEKKLHVIFNSLNHEKQILIRQKLVKGDIYKNHFKNNDPIILFIGRIQNAKKLDLIIRSQQQLVLEGRQFNVVFIGEGESEQQLKELADRYSLSDKVWFYGSCYDEEQIALFIYNATMTVSPGSVGLTAIHSLSYGTPVITHANFKKQGPEFEAIDPGITGDFFIEDDIDDLSLKISSWIEKSQNKREVIRTNCYKIIDLYYNPNYQIMLLKSLLI